MKKAILGVILFTLIAVVYFLWSNNKKSVEQQPITKPDINENDSGLGFLTVPDGFKISIAADGLDSPRVMVFDERGRMLVSETKAGRVRILEDKDKDGEFESKNTLIENLISLN